MCLVSPLKKYSKFFLERLGYFKAIHFGTYDRPLFRQKHPLLFKLPSTLAHDRPNDSRIKINI